MDIYTKQNINILFFAKTPYQLLVMSYLALKLKEKVNAGLNFVLITDSILDRCWEFFDESIWNEVISERLTFYPTTKLSQFLHDKRKKIDLVNKLKQKFDYINLFFFSNGEDVLVPLIIDQFSSCISFCVSEGSASYNSSQISDNPSLFKRMVKLILFNALNLLNGRGILADGLFQMQGGNKVNGYIDIRINKATSRYKENRILYELDLVDLMEKSEKVVKIPDEIRMASSGQPRILFMTGCLSEDKDISEERELSFYQEVISVFQRKGYQVYVKSHPRENLEKIAKIKSMVNHVVFLDKVKNIPAEVLFMRIKFKTLCGIVTSAIWNGYNLGVAEKYFMLSNLYKKSGGFKKLSPNGMNDEIKHCDNVFYPEDWKTFEDNV